MCNPNQIMELGWIRLHRKMTDWRYYGLPNVMAVFVHLLLTANHKNGFVFGVEVKRGQVLTSEDSIMRSIRIKRGALRGVLTKLEESGEIVRKSTNKYSLITVCNYDSYQGGTDANNQQPAINEPSAEHQEDINPTSAEQPPATNNNDKNVKNGKNERKEEENIALQNAKSEFEAFHKSYPGTKRKLDTEFGNFIKKHKDWKKVLPLLMQAVQSYILHTQGQPKKYIKHLQTWINQRCWEEEYSNTDNTDERNQNLERKGISKPSCGIILPDGIG